MVSCPVIVVVVILPAVRVLDTVRLVKAPIAVMLGWLAVANTPFICVPVTVPAVTVPVTDKLLSTPMAVILVWDASVTVPAVTENCGIFSSRYSKLASNCARGMMPLELAN